MKNILFIIFFLPLYIFAQVKETNHPDMKKVEAAVTQWANQTFADYTEPRFNKFIPYYTDDYFLTVIAVKNIDKVINEQKKMYASGSFTGSKEDFEKSISELETRKETAIKNRDNFNRKKVDYYQISFWANIKMSSNVYNYIEHIVLVDENMNIKEATINSHIGKKDDFEKIIYK
ncbi:MAG: hypothetical protein H3C31_00755 [Brumimicrobium sp.]|nr:hypothetical protein [Brumimicrobium sp.]